MNCKWKKGAALFLTAALCLSAGGCSSGKKADQSTDGAGKTAALIDSLNSDEMFTDRDKEIGYEESTAVSILLSDQNTKCTSDLVKVSGDTVTITEEGTYLLSGALTNGQIVVEAEKTDKLHLVFQGVNVNCDTSAALYVKQADKVFITLDGSSRNTLSNKSEFAAVDENNIDAVLFSKADMTLNGKGSLTVQAAYGHGIVSKDDLAVTGGSYSITAAGHALSGKDSVRIADGTFALSSGKDGVHAENTEDASKGFLYIAQGDFTIASQGDGLDTSCVLQVEGGTFQIQSGGGSGNAATRQENGGLWKENTTSADAGDTVSTKGMKAGGNLMINGGKITIDAADDALHSNANAAIQAGELSLSTGDDGIHADAGASISGGTVTVSESYEGLEGQTIEITGGTISITASDDGLNAAGGNDQSGFGGGMRKDEFASDSDCAIKISGGTIKVNASGDGIDSNGDLYVSGGETYVSGPTSSGNGALDYNGNAQITGGIFVAVGASGMAQNFGGSSTQGSILVNSNGSGGEVVLKDSSGAVLLSYTPEKSYHSVVVSCPQIKKGDAYTLTAGGQTVSVEMTSLIYGSGGGGQPGGGRRGGF